MTRVQILMDEQEREQLRQQAEAEGMSLSAWIRRAALQKLQTARESEALTSQKELRRFFARCKAREKGREPDWDDHRRVMEVARGTGSSRT